MTSVSHWRRDSWKPYKIQVSHLANYSFDFNIISNQNLFFIICAFNRVLLLWWSKAQPVLRSNPQQLDGSVVIYLLLFDSVEVCTTEEEL